MFIRSSHLCPKMTGKACLQRLHEIWITLPTPVNSLIVSSLPTNPLHHQILLFFLPFFPPVLEQKSKENFTLFIKWGYKYNSISFRDPQPFWGGATVILEIIWGWGDPSEEENIQVMKSIEWMSKDVAGLTHLYR